jgi:UDP-2,3-diacylglucosamine hydrolase
VNEEYLFISDCHLDVSRPEVAAELIKFIDERAVSASHLYILGDLFEVWLGDDDPATEQQPVIDSLQRLAGKTEIFFIAGNRDFLLGQAFATKVGFTLLDEPKILRLGAERVVLIHGDTLCTDDHDYQEFRSLVRTAAWKTEFLAQTLAERRQIAAQLRSDSAGAMALKSLEIMDVNQQAVADCFQQNDVDTIIHGHTHRPAVHRYESNLSRYVLGDWNPGPSYLSWNSVHGFELFDSRI